MSNPIPYLIVIACALFVGVGGAVAVVFARPAADNSILVAAILGFPATIAASVIATMRATETLNQARQNADSLCQLHSKVTDTPCTKSSDPLS